MNYFREVDKGPVAGAIATQSSIGVATEDD